MLLLYRQRWGLCYLPVIALAILAIVASARWLFPLPPRSVVLATGPAADGFATVADRYRDELERRGIAVDTLTNASPSLSALQRLANLADPVHVGFAHGLLAERGPEAPVHALAVIGKEPLWLFTRHSGVLNLQMLRGMRVAAGPEGSPTRDVAAKLFAQANLRPSDVVWSTSPGGMVSANDLLEHRVDAMVAIGSGEAPTVNLLSHTPGIYLLSLERADSLAAREPRLHPFVLPQGAIELRGDVPPRDLTMLYTGTHLLARESVHPALQRALLDAATEIHALPTFLQRQSEFPDYQSDFPLSPVAQTYAAGQRPWLERVLPYWWAQLAELMLYAVLPILLVAGAALVWIPRLFSLRVDAVLAHYYGELNFLEKEVDAVASEKPIRIRDMVARMDQMEYEIASLDLPDRFADRWYTLRQHLMATRDRLIGMRAR